jgi:hypothetical protein
MSFIERFHLWVTEAETAWKLPLLQEADLKQAPKHRFFPQAPCVLWQVGEHLVRRLRTVPASVYFADSGGQQCTRDFRHNE